MEVPIGPDDTKQIVWLKLILATFLYLMTFFRAISFLFDYPFKKKQKMGFGKRDD